MEQLYEKALESADYIRSHTAARPKIAVVLGSGLGNLTAAFTETEELPYRDIPHFPVSTVAGHRGALLTGRLGQREVYALEGRFHFYEGYTMKEVCYPFYTLKLLGVEQVILTNAAGGVNLGYKPGDIMIINDQIMLPGCSPMRGPNIPEFGPRFFDVQKMYSPELRAVARECAQGSGLTFHEGCYFFMQGPQFETPAEIRAIRTLGGDAVGMSTVTEALTAAHCGMPCLGFSVITNMAAGILDQPLTDEEVNEVGHLVADNFSAYLKKVLTRM